MRFLDRKEELSRLGQLVERPSGGLAVIYGRRRIGKSRLLVEWSRRHSGLYSVADQSTSGIQRRYLATAIGEQIPGFGDVEYPDWRALLARLAQEARHQGWRGPVIVDELPYLVSAAPELPSVLQRWLDRDAADARLAVAVAGSSQRMMQGLVLDAAAPLYGRAREVMELGPLPVSCFREAFDYRAPTDVIELYTAWGGVPRYWELACEITGGALTQLAELALDPSGPLHREPDRLLMEELPPAMEVRPVLDAIGAGAHRVSEIAGRLGRPATSLSRPLDRLLGLDLAQREVPFGESPKRSKRTLYRINDPFMRFWFRVVAPNRALLASGDRTSRRQLLLRSWPALVAQSWEQLCRASVPHLPSSLGAVRGGGPWGPASRWWHGNAPEWDVVSDSLDERRLLLGDVKWSHKPLAPAKLAAALSELAARTPPALGSSYATRQHVRVLFVPGIQGKRPRTPPDMHIVTAADVMR